jgi:RNase P subunit RPR2
MSCCNNVFLYVETDHKIHKERSGEFVVMCKSCGWSDKYVFMNKGTANQRLAELIKNNEGK